MRERLFKGFHHDENGRTEITINGVKLKGEWVMGDGIHYPKSINYKGTCWIDGMQEKANDWVQIIPETVCEVVEINGSLFSEGDIIEARHPLSGNYVAQGVIRFGEFEGLNENTYFGFYIEWHEKYAVDYRKSIKWWATKRSLEVIGSIFETEGKNE